MDRVDGGARVIGHATSDNGYVDAFGIKARHEVADIERHIGQQQVGASTGPQNRERLIVAVGVSDVRAFLHRELGRGGELAPERADDREFAWLAPYHSREIAGNRAHQLWSA